MPSSSVHRDSHSSRLTRTVDQIWRESLISRRQLLWCAPGLAWASTAGDAFWNTKPSSQWSAGEIYQLLKHFRNAGLGGVAVQYLEILLVT